MGLLDGLLGNLMAGRPTAVRWTAAPPAVKALRSAVRARVHW